MYRSLNQETAFQSVDYVVEKLPFAVDTIQSDKGAEFQRRLQLHVLNKGINPIYIKPRTPRLNGEVEHSQRIDAAELHRLLEGMELNLVIRTFSAR